jgi:hypothetical protein
MLAPGLVRPTPTVCARAGLGPLTGSRLDR